MKNDETYIKVGIENFLGGGCQQTVGLIKIHQAPIRYEPVSLHKIPKKEDKFKLGNGKETKKKKKRVVV